MKWHLIKQWSRGHGCYGLADLHLSGDKDEVIEAAKMHIAAACLGDEKLKYSTLGGIRERFEKNRELNFEHYIVKVLSTDELNDLLNASGLRLMIARGD